MLTATTRIVRVMFAAVLLAVGTVVATLGATIRVEEVHFLVRAGR